MNFSIYSHSDKSAVFQFFKVFSVFALAGFHHRRHDEYKNTFVIFHYNISYGISGNRLYRHMAIRALGSSGSGKKQVQKIVNFGNGSHGRTRITPRDFLINRKCRRQTFYMINMGPFNSAHKLPGIGRQGIKIAPLPFFIYGIKSQRRFTGAGNPGDDDKGIARQIKINAGEIVFAVIADSDVIFHGRF